MKAALQKSNESRELAANCDKLDLRPLIHVVRDYQVMLDKDLAKLYGVEVKQLNRQVKRNIERFPADFMFQLSKDDCSRCQIGTLNEGRGGNVKYLPYAFTENGIAMLSSVLRSQIAIEVNIRIMRAFFEMRRSLAALAPVLNRLDVVERRQIADQTQNEVRFKKLFDKMSEGDIPPAKIFFNGEYWDAKSLLVKIIRRAKENLILIDPYLGTATLDILAKRLRGVKIELITSSRGELAESDFEAFGRQFGNLKVSYCGVCHDRYIIEDGKSIYAVGASLKDAGRQTFSIIKTDDLPIPELLVKLRNAIRVAKDYGEKQQ